MSPDGFVVVVNLALQLLFLLIRNIHFVDLHQFTFLFLVWRSQFASTVACGFAGLALHNVLLVHHGVAPFDCANYADLLACFRVASVSDFGIVDC